MTTTEEIPLPPEPPKGWQWELQPDKSWKLVAIKSEHPPDEGLNPKGPRYL